MSQENVEMAKRMIAAFNAGDVDGFTALTTPDFEWSPSMLAIEGQFFRGPQGIRRYFAILDEAWDEFLIHADRFRESPGFVVVLGRLSGCGKTSGATVDAVGGIVIDIRDRKIARLRGFLDQGAALKAVGLAE